MGNRYTLGIFQDLLVIGISILIAVYMVRSDVLAIFLSQTSGISWVGSFIAGLFFTSIFTTAPAIATLAELTRYYGILPVALIGAFGAVVGDLILFRFVRDRFAEHLLGIVGHRGLWRKVRAFFHLRLFRWLSLFIGGLIIASPFPDELGISILGFSKLRTSWFIPLSYLFNMLGIILIGLVAQVA